MNDSGEMPIIEEKSSNEAPSKAVNWTALKRATGSASIQTENTNSDAAEPETTTPNAVELDATEPAEQADSLTLGEISSEAAQDDSQVKVVAEAPSSPAESLADGTSAEAKEIDAQTKASSKETAPVREKQRKAVNWTALKKATEDSAYVESTETSLEDASAKEKLLEENSSDATADETDDDLENSQKSVDEITSSTAEVAPIENSPVETPLVIDSTVLQRAAAILRNGHGGRETKNVAAKPEVEVSEPEVSEPNEKLQNSLDGSLETESQPKREDSGNLKSDALVAEINALRDEVHLLLRGQAEMVERGTAQEKVFNVLHAELQDYKNDFVYERFKPTVQSLLFLCDSLEQFDKEMADEEVPDSEERQQGLSPQIVRENIAYFRVQLVEALATCAVTPMETPQGEFDPHRHKAVKLVAVAHTADNVVQEVVRGGWYLNGQLLRPAEVIVGRAKRAESRKTLKHE